MTIQPFSVCQTAWALSGIQNLMESQLICAGSTALNGAAACTVSLALYLGMYSTNNPHPNFIPVKSDIGLTRLNLS